MFACDQRLSFQHFLALCLLVLGAVSGCSSEPPLSQLSGKVTFKGKPVPAGYISFTPNIDLGTNGRIRVFQISDGVYDSSSDRNPGIPAGNYLVRIAGFDGKPIPRYGQGKQIFNPIDETYIVADGETEIDWEVPDSAGENVRIEPTADL